MHPYTRRRFLSENAMGIGSMALAWLLQEKSARATPKKLPKDPIHFDLTPKEPHFAPQATAMISMFPASKCATGPEARRSRW